MIWALESLPWLELAPETKADERAPFSLLRSLSMMAYR
jgi:hypothetical protein